MRKPGCAECEQLFQEYSSATFAHVSIENRVKMAELRQEVTVALSGDYHTATHKREVAHRQLKEHEATHAAARASSMD